jgi:hypothetical protein
VLPFIARDNGVKFLFSIASPVSCSDFSTMGVVVVNSLFNEIICFKSVSDEFSAIIKDKKIKIQQDEIKNLQTTVTKLSTKPAQKTITIYNYRLL